MQAAAAAAGVLGGLRRRSAFGGPARSRKSRYVVTAVLAVLVVWALVAAYLVGSPRSYSAGFVLILPGSGTGSSMNLDSVGSASSTTASVFSSPDMSPTENYRKLLMGQRLRTEAASRTGEPVAGFPTPKVDLADQTKLISVTVSARSPEAAADRARAIQSAFTDMLNRLRADEIVQRDIVYQELLTGYKERLQQARDRLIEHQAATGLVSLDQYGTMVSALERLHDQQRDNDLRLLQANTEISRLGALLGTTPEVATLAMTLRADPTFQALLDQAAKQEAEIATLNGIRSNGNPRLQDAVAERASVYAKIGERGGELTGLKRAELLKLRDLSLKDGRAQLFERLVTRSADAATLSRTQTMLAEQIAAEQGRVLRLAEQASKLENLRRDVQVAEAVFTSALARNDTSKADFFASYPMVQTLEAPFVPLWPSSPQPVLAIAGGVGATFLILAALVLAWLRLALFRRILKNA